MTGVRLTGRDLGSDKMTNFKSRLTTTLLLQVGGVFLATCLCGSSAYAQDSSAPKAETQSGEDLATARVYFRNGVELLQGANPNYQDAYRQFELAYQYSQSWKVLGNLGLCALKLERDGEALAFYAEYFEKGGDEIEPNERASIERELLLIRGSIATVQLESSDPSAKITVKRQGSSAPAQRYDLKDGKAELGVRSGSLVITAKNAEKTLTWEVVLDAEESQSHTFDFAAQPETEDPDAVAQSSSTSAESSTETHGPSGLRVAGFVSLGVGVAALGGGLATGLISNSKEKAANRDASSTCINDICPESIGKQYDSAKSMATVANILLISGGVLAATGVTLIIVGGNKSTTASPQDSATLQLSPLVTAGGGGFAALGRF